MLFTDGKILTASNGTWARQIVWRRLSPVSIYPKYEEELTLVRSSNVKRHLQAMLVGHGDGRNMRPDTAKIKHKNENNEDLREIVVVC